MEKVFDTMKKEGDQMMKDMMYVQNFDFENATEEELEKFQKFVEARTLRTQQVKKEMEKLKNKIQDLK
jgi:hypothetical protein